MAVTQNFNTKWSFAKDYSLLHSLSVVFEDLFYLQIHEARPDHFINFAIHFDRLLIGGTPFIWMLMEREITDLIR